MSDNAAQKRPSYEELEQKVAEQARRIAALEEQVVKLTTALEEARRAGKRQAGPFAKGDPKRSPKKPGRKPGDGYGKQASRAEPQHVDEVVEAPLPPLCPFCGDRLDETHVDEQLQTDIPEVRPHVTKIRVHVGRCRRCKRRIQGRHARQTSDALGAAGNQIGPNALAIAAHLNKVVGATYGKVARFFSTVLSITVAPSTLVRAIQRLAAKAEPAHEAAIDAVRQSPVVYPDETGWRVGGHRSWLWTFVAVGAVVYRIKASRGFDVPEEILGADYDGSVGCDGWAPYRKLLAARFQLCLAHLLRRCHELLEVATRGAVRFPRAVKKLLDGALALRDRRDAGSITAHGLATRRGQLEAELDRLLAWDVTHRENRKLLRHLASRSNEIFTFLYDPMLEATNWPAEQAIRPAVLARKVSGGNRTDAGAHAHEVLLTTLGTCARRGIETIPFLRDLLTARDPGKIVAASFA